MRPGNSASVRRVSASHRAGLSSSPAPPSSTVPATRRRRSKRENTILYSSSVRLTLGARSGSMMSNVAEYPLAGTICRRIPSGASSARVWTPRQATTASAFKRVIVLIAVHDLGAHATIPFNQHTPDSRIQPELDALLPAPLGKLHRVGMCIARLVLGTIVSADDAVAYGRQRRFQIDRFIGRDRASITAQRTHQRRRRARKFEIGIVRIEVKDAALTVRIVERNVCTQLLQNTAAIKPKRDQPARVFRSTRSRALAKKGQAPRPLIGAQARPKQQWSVLASQPLQHLARSTGIRPRFRMADRDLSTVGKTRFATRRRSAVR